MTVRDGRGQPIGIGTVFDSSALGVASAMAPAAVRGMAGTWKGMMIGADVSDAVTRGHFLRGDATLIIDDSANPDIDVTFSNLRDLETGARLDGRTIGSWENIPINGGSFGNKPTGSNDYIQGRFVGEPTMPAQIKITKRTVDRITGDGSDKFYWDDDLPGFGLRVRASGRKYYVVQFRANGRLRRMTLGRHGAVTPETARRRAMALISEAKGGKDPAALRDKGRKAATMKVLGRRFLEEYVPVHCKPSTAYEYRRSVKFFIDPRIGTRKVTEIQRSDIAELHHGMRETPYQANRTLGVLSKMFNLAELWGLRPDGSETRSAAAAIRLLMLTGCRLSEIQKLRWEHVDLDAAEIHLPTARLAPARFTCRLRRSASSRPCCASPAIPGSFRETSRART